MADRVGLYYTYMNGMTGDASIEWVTIDGGIIYYSTEWVGMIGEDSPSYLQGGEITWYDVSDPNGLQG